MNKIKFLIISLAVILIFILIHPYISEYLNFEYIKKQQDLFQSFYSEHPVLVPVVFFLVYFIGVSFALPQAALMTLVAGVLFGLFWGTILASFASSFGALASFLIARYLLGNKLQEKYPHRFKKMNDGVEREGGFYLFTLRMVPLFPFFLINLLMGITKIKTKTYYFITQLASLPGTIVYVYLGTTLADLDSLSEGVPYELLIAFALLGVTPIIFKKVVEIVRKKRLKTQN